MGNASGRKEDIGSSGTKNEVGEEVFMEYAHGGGPQVSSYHAPEYPFSESMVQSPPHSPRAYQSPFSFTPQVPIIPLGRPNEITQIQRDELKETAKQYDARFSEKGIPVVITWIHEGNQVAVKGSWNDWMQKEPLEKSGEDFTIMKVLNSGVYHYHFIVDGEWRYAPELPQECDEMGNIFNILDLQGHVAEVLSTVPESESPSSPISSYNNAPFTLEDHDEKYLPELPPLLRQMPLDLPSYSKDWPETLQKPLSAVLNHLYIQRGESGQPTVALSSTRRFRAKYVTVVLYKSLKAATN